MDIVVDPGECVSLMGASGSGKSLLLRALADLDPHEGHVSLDDVSCSEIPAPKWRSKVGMLPAESAWWADSVAPHFPRGFSGEGLTPFGFEADALSWTIHRLSTGERQRLAIAHPLRDHEMNFIVLV